MRTIPAAIKTLLKSKTMIGVNAPHIRVSVVDSAPKVAYREIWNSTGTPQMSYTVSGVELRVSNNSQKGTFGILFYLNKNYINDNDVMIEFDAVSLSYSSGDGSGLWRCTLDGYYAYDSLVDFPDSNSSITMKGTKICPPTIVAGGATATNKTFWYHISTGDYYVDGVKVFSGSFQNSDGETKTWADFRSPLLTVGFGFYINSTNARRFDFKSVRLRNFTTYDSLYSLPLGIITAENTGTTYDYGYFDQDGVQDLYLPLSSVNISKEEAANAQSCSISFPNVNPTDPTDAGYYSPYRSGADFLTKIKNEWYCKIIPSKDILVEAGYGTDMTTIFTGTIDDVICNASPKSATLNIETRDYGWKLIDKNIVTTIDGSTEYYIDYPIDELTSSIWLTSDMFIVMNKGNQITLQSDLSPGAITLILTNNTYTGANLATHLQTVMNATDALTGTGTITFTVTYDDIYRIFTIDAGLGHTITFKENDSTAGDLMGFTAGVGPTQSIESVEPCYAMIETIVKDLCVRAGFAPDDITIEPTYINLEISFDRMSYGDAIEQLCTLSGFEILIDDYGHVSFHYPTDRQPEALDEEVVLNGTTAVDLTNYPIVTTSIVVYSGAGKTGMKCSSVYDYLITPGDYENNWSIERRAGSSIPDGATVYVSYVYAAYVFKEGIDIFNLGLATTRRDLYGQIFVEGDTCSGLYLTTTPRWDGSNVTEDKVLFVQDENIDSDAKAQGVADRLGADMICRTVTSEFAAIAIPWLQVGDCIQIIESSSTISEIYKITSLSFYYGLKEAMMSMKTYHYGYAPLTKEVIPT
jgi:hypothetical protein